MKQAIGVVGAGTMGAGIAFVALSSGRRVHLFDVNADVLKTAITYIESNCQRLVKRGAISEEGAEDLKSRLSTTNLLADLKECAVIVEAIPERMELKQKLFADLDELCDPTTILATNTSSLSVTVMASCLRHPERFVGMHFFNPAPVMKLVEVVVGDDTSADTAEAIKQLCMEFGKQAIACKDTPGFIVNRVARNFYGESLRIVGEGTATMDAVDAILTQGAHFKMGPFALMDLIGIDVNLDVTKAVYGMFHGDPRYRPHRIQETLVQSRRLGKKCGRGFYRYDENGHVIQNEANSPDVVLPTKMSDPCRIAVIGDTPLAHRIADRIKRNIHIDGVESALLYSGPLPQWDDIGRQWRADEVEAFVRRTAPDAIFISFAGDTLYERMLLQSVDRAANGRVPLLVSLAGLSATERASWLRHPERVRGFNLIPIGDTRLDVESDEVLMEWSQPLQVSLTEGQFINDVVESVTSCLALRTIRVRDGAGGVMMRTLSMIFNEALEVVREEIATPEDVDVAMRLGTNYPSGPIKWLSEIGVPSVYKTLAALFEEFGDDRYRPSPLLRHIMLSEQSGRFGHLHNSITSEV